MEKETGKELGCAKHIHGLPAANVIIMYCKHGQTKIKRKLKKTFLIADNTGGTRLQLLLFPEGRVAILQEGHSLQ